MGKIKLLLIIIGCLMVAMPQLKAQVKSGKTSLDKGSAKGNFGGMYALDNGNLAMFYMHKDGVSAYEFNANAAFVKAQQNNGAIELLDRAMFTNEQASVANLKEFTSMDVMFVASSWGALKLQKGLLGLKSDNKFIYGFDYEKIEDRKLKAEDTWRTNIIGNRAIIPDDLKMVKFKGDNGRYMSYTFSPIGISSMAPITGYIQSVGVVTEKVNIREPSTNHFNRLVIFKVGGKSLDETNNIHIMPYAMQGVGSGISAKGNFIALTMPLNAPSTVAAQKALLAPDEDKSNLYIYEIDDNNQVVAEAMHKSDLRTVNFQTVATHNKTIVIGTGAEGKNWRMFYAGQTAMSGLTYAVLNLDGKVIATKTYLDKDFASKFELAGSGKAKLQKFTGGPNFYQAETLENGNTFILGKSDGYHHGILLSPEHELIKYIIFPHADVTKHHYYTHQLEVRGNKIFLVNSDQPHELSNAVQESTSSRSSTSGNIKTTTTSTTKSQIFEIFHVTQLFTIDGATGKSELHVLNEIQKNFNSMGNIPALFTSNAIYFPGRIKAPNGKELALIRYEF
jgi:hypothetical protein